MSTGRRGATALAAPLAAAAIARAETAPAIAPVDNGDMIGMQRLAADFPGRRPCIALERVTLEQHALRRRVTTDIAGRGGPHDMMAIRANEVEVRAKPGRLAPHDGAPAGCDVDDILPATGGGLTCEGALASARNPATRKMERGDHLK